LNAELFKLWRAVYLPMPVVKAFQTDQRGMPQYRISIVFRLDFTTLGCRTPLFSDDQSKYFETFTQKVIEVNQERLQELKEEVCR